MEIILATTSAGRKEVFSRLGIPFTMEDSNFDESNPERPDYPDKLVSYLSRKKAEAVAQNHRDEDVVIAGFDSVGYHDFKIFEKPKSEAEAFSRLRRISGDFLTYMTGIYMINPKRNQINEAIATTYVYLRKISDEEIARYLKQDTKFKSHSLGFTPFENFSSSFISEIQGSPSNLTGMPLERVVSMLAEMGFKF